LLRAGARPERVRTVLNGIDHEAFVRNPARVASMRDSLGFGSTDVVIGSVGRLEPQKRFDLLIDAFAEARQAHPGLRLVIAGDGSLAGSLRAQVDRLALGSSCLLLGHRSDVVDLHHAFDLYVQSSDYEGTPNAVLEAMALETPVVATDVGGTSQLVADGRDGLIVPLRDHAALVRAIDAVVCQPNQAKARATAARRRIETDLSFSTRMARVEEIYEELMAHRHRQGATPVALRA